MIHFQIFAGIEIEILKTETQRNDCLQFQKFFLEFAKYLKIKKNHINIDIIKNLITIYLYVNM